MCGLAEFVATEVSAQGTPPPAPAGFTRKILSQMDGPMPGYVTIIAEVTIDPGTLVGGIRTREFESGYVVAGAFELPIEGQPTRMVKAGDGFQVPVATPHAGGKIGDKGSDRQHLCRGERQAARYPGLIKSRFQTNRFQQAITGGRLSWRPLFIQSRRAMSVYGT